MLNETSLKKSLNDIKESTLVITFINKQYIDIFKLFLFFWKKHKLSNLLVICLDQESAKFLCEANIPYVLYNYSIKKRADFWKIRLQIINQIFQTAQKTIIHTDSDCFWLKNVNFLLNKMPEGDIIYSIGHGHPKEIAIRYGFVCCCGFFCIRYNQYTKTYFDTLCHLNEQDDQVATNRWLFSNAKQIVRLSSTDIFTALILLENLTVYCLSNAIISRQKNQTFSFLQKCFCYHPFLVGSKEQRIKDSHFQMRFFL